jgi:hypothetical protein
MPVRIDRLPPISRPGAGRGDHFPITDRRSSTAEAPDYAVDAVRAILRDSRRPTQQKEIARQLHRTLERQGRPRPVETCSSYTSKALRFLYREGFAMVVSDDPREWCRVA